jgi:hypothetical protein
MTWADENDGAAQADDAGTGHPPAGWYDDPGGSGRERYWDGMAWTERLSGEHSQPPLPTGPPAPPRRPSPLSALPWRKIGLGTLAAAILAGLLVGAWVLSRVADDTDERLADTRSQLQDTRGELEDAKTQLESLNTRAESAEKERDELADQVTQLTGEEPGGSDLEGVKAVSKGKTLKLEELEATLVGYQVTDTVSDEYDTRRADGKFVTLTVTVKNRLSSPQSLDPQEHFSLVIEGEEFTPDFDAMNYAGGDKSWLDIGLDDLQPGTPKTGTVTFDVSTKAAKSAQAGTLLLVQFSDASSFDEEPALPIAGLKLG